MKVLYEEIEQPSEVLERLHSSIEELFLPCDVFDQLQKDLDLSHDRLPEPAKHILPPTAMRKWKVALLERFDPLSKGL